MNRRSMIVATMWLLGPPIYLVSSAAITHGFALAMMYWARQSGVSHGIEPEILLLQKPVFLLCLFWAVLYASALAKPSAFGRTSRVLRHLGWSYFAGLLSCVLPVRVAFMPLPEFRSLFAVSTFIFCELGLSALCFLFAMVVWAHCAFSLPAPNRHRTAVPTQPKPSPRATSLPHLQTPQSTAPGVPAGTTSSAA